MRVVYSCNNGDIPLGLEGEVETLIAKYSRYIPKHVRRLDIHYSNDVASEDTDIAAVTHVSDEYGAITIIIAPHFLVQPRDEREWTFVHELCHGINNPIAQALRNTNQALLLVVGECEGSFKQAYLQGLMETQRIAIEQATSQLATALFERENDDGEA